MHVTGVSIWAPGFANLDAWLSGKRDVAVEQPDCAIANGRLLRGTSLLTRMLVEVAAAAGQNAGLDLAETPSVFGSSFGEIQIALMQMDMWRTGDGVVSPHRFKNSVHNTGAGVFSIAARNRGFTTAIAGGWQTTAMCLLEAAGLLSSGARSVVVAVGEEALPPPLQQQHDYSPLAVGFVLSSQASRASLSLSDLRPTSSIVATDLPAEFAGNPCAPALALAVAIATTRHGTIGITHRGHEHWAVDLR